MSMKRKWVNTSTVPLHTCRAIAKTEKALRSTRDKINVAKEKYLLQEGNINKKTFEKVTAALKSQEYELQKRLAEISENAEE
jgi:hypothetical protein